MVHPMPSYTPPFVDGLGFRDIEWRVSLRKKLRYSETLVVDVMTIHDDDPTAINEFHVNAARERMSELLKGIDDGYSDNRLRLFIEGYKIGAGAHVRFMSKHPSLLILKDEGTREIRESLDRAADTIRNTSVWWAVLRSDGGRRLPIMKEHVFLNHDAAYEYMKTMVDVELLAAPSLVAWGKHGKPDVTFGYFEDKAHAEEFKVAYGDGELYVVDREPRFTGDYQRNTKGMGRQDSVLLEGDEA